MLRQERTWLDVAPGEELTERSPMRPTLMSEGEENGYHEIILGHP